MIARTLGAAFLLATTSLANAEPQCQVGEVPDPSCTPGVVAATDEADVCGMVEGLSYSKRHRQTPDGLKRSIFARYGIDPDVARTQDWEVDHVVPLCAGGADVVYNLFPQSGVGTWSYHVKDRMEAEVCRRVCHQHALTLQAGQSLFTPDWRVGYCLVFPADIARCQAQ